MTMKIEEYLEKARECRAMPGRPEIKAKFNKMAEAWEELAANRKRGLIKKLAAAAAVARSELIVVI